MSTQAHTSKAAAPPWVETRVHAAVGLLLFAVLLAGAVAYGVFVLLPVLLKDQVELIFERYNTLLPDFTSGAMPPWMWVWAGAGFLGALALAAGNVFLLATSRQRHPALFWGWLGATAVLVAPPVMFLFLLPSVPKLPGGMIWWFLTAAGLTAGFFYVAWMYFRDSHGVGPLWASLLGLLRAGVFTLLAFFFMLPAVRTYADSFSRSKVLILGDVSGSMAYTIDDIPSDAMPLDKLPARQDKVLAFLADEKVKFLRRLEEKNPVDFYRFARSLDPEFLHFAQDGNGYMRWEWDAAQKAGHDPKAAPPGELPPEFLRQWMKPTVETKPADEWDEATQERYRRLLGLNDDLLKKDADFANATNVGDSALALVDNESKKMVQGVIIFTDGRSNEGSPTAFENLKEHALANHVPIFVVAVGEERPKVKIEIADVRVPQQIQPDDKFPAVVEVTGEGLPDQPVSVELEVTYVHKGRDGKEELLPIGVTEAVEAKPGKEQPTKQVVALGKRIVLHPAEPPRFDKGSPPRVEVQYQVDAAALAAAADPPVKLDPAVRKWEIVETVPESELRFRAVVPRNPKEIFAAKEHVSDPAGMIVQKKPLRVLLFASAATHEYQFLQAMLVRDMTKGRVKVASYLQMPPGRTEPREGIVQDAPLLKRFPDQIDRKFAVEEDKQYDLSEYDVIVAFDPDWTQLSEDSIKLLKQWADKGGGLVYVAGSVNTFQLARPAGAGETERYKPILELLPVTLQDIRLAEASRDTERAWPLDFTGATPDMEFLKLAEDAGAKEGGPKFLDDWKDFFGPIQPDGSVTRGFYNFYPVDSAKPGAQVVARFGDPSVKLNKDQSLMPFLVLSNPQDPDHRIVWLGWGEMWRLRQKDEKYLERFWTKLTRYAGGLNQGKVVKRITPNFGRVFTVGQNVVMEARIDDKGGVRLNENARPKVVIKAPLLGGKLTEQQKRDLEDLQKEKWMTYKPKSDGWFAVHFRPPVEGDYQMEVTVNETGDKVTHKFTVKPSNPELDEARPDFARMYEMASYADEYVQPPRMTAADYAELLQKLQRPKLEDEKETAKEDRPKLYFNLKNADLIPKCMDQTSNQRRDYSDPRPVWNVPVPFHWLPGWAALLLSVSVALGFVAGFFFFREPRAGMKAGLLAALGAVTGLVSLVGYYMGRSLGWGGWVLLAGAVALLIAPLFVPHVVDLGWFAFTALVALLCTEWLIRKLLRLA